MKVRIITGAAHTYAAIEHKSGSMDVQIHSGIGCAHSLRKSAEELEKKIKQYQKRALLMREAADCLDCDQ